MLNFLPSLRAETMAPRAVSKHQLPSHNPKLALLLALFAGMPIKIKRARGFFPAIRVYVIDTM